MCILTDKLEVNEHKLMYKNRKNRSFSLQTFLFDGRNNIVWVVKQYCFTCQTQVFDFSNNIVSQYKYSFLPLLLNIYAFRLA